MKRFSGELEKFRIDDDIQVSNVLHKMQFNATCIHTNLYTYDLIAPIQMHTHTTKYICKIIRQIVSLRTLSICCLLPSWYIFCFLSFCLSSFNPTFVKSYVERMQWRWLFVCEWQWWGLCGCCCYCGTSNWICIYIRIVRQKSKKK